MESDLWRGFAAVAATGSFTQAADRLPISQSGLSQQLRRLESLLGVILLERTSRNVELTEIGQRLLPLAIELIDKENAILAAAKARGDGTDTEVVEIFVAEDATDDLLIRLIEQLRSTAPGVRVQVTQVSIARQVDALVEAGPCAAMIERTPTPQPVGPGRRTSLRSEPLAVVLPVDADAPAALTVDEAARLKIRPMSWLPQSWLDWFPLLNGSEHAEPANPVLVVTSFRSAVQSVPLDHQPCIAPRSIAESVSGTESHIVSISDAPLASLDLVSLGEHPLVDLLHAVSATIGTSNAANAAGSAVDRATTSGRTPDA